jgi:membrane fusion protein (multidrug efflux system)
MQSIVRKSVVGLFILSAFSILLYSCNNSDTRTNSGDQSSISAYPVLELQPRSIVLTSSYPATLEGHQTVEIRPRLQGYIVEMPVDEGDIVEEGERLFKLNSEQYEQELRSARADVEVAKAAVNTAEDEVKRLKRLAEQDIISDYRLQSAQNTLQSKKASLSRAHATLKNAEVNLGYTSIESPTDGVIGTIPYRIGSLVSSTISKPLTVVADISIVHAYFSMSERELLEMAQRVSGSGGNKTLQQKIADMPRVKLELPDGSIYNQKGTLQLASGHIKTQTGSASFRAKFSNPREILRSGGSGNVRIPFRRDSAMIIPKKSTYEIQNKRFVYTVTDSNTVTSTPVRTLSLSTPKLFVVEEGLSPGSHIVTEGMGDLQDGTEIDPHPVNSDSLYNKLTEQDQP